MRRQAAVDEIVEAAWDLSRTEGLGNFSMRQLGERVGMRAQSLYSYFGSKNEIFDAMFRDGNERLLEALRRALEAGGRRGPVAAGEAVVEEFVRFGTSDPTRYQLLFQRTIPGFVPSEQSYAVAQEVYELSVRPLRDLGIDETGLDLATAVITGIVSQQISNDPGGDRWSRLAPQATTMLLAHLAPQALEESDRTSGT